MILRRTMRVDRTMMTSSPALVLVCECLGQQLRLSVWVGRG